MRFVTFLGDSGQRIGAVVGDGVVDLTARLGDDAVDFGRFLTAGLSRAEAIVASASPDFALGDLTLLPVSPNPSKILCAAVNYAEHREEMGRDPTERPMLFTRFADSLTGHGQPLVKTHLSDQFDYEGELAVIIGQTCRHVAPERALDVLAGYACFNDGTIRDYQRHTSQFTPGKNFHRSGSLGPWMMTREAFGDYKRQSLVTRLNGVEVQRTTIDLMLFDIETLIAYITSFTTLRPGDVIATGTCGGVGVKRNPPLFMKPGDRVEVEVSGLGLLSNPVEAA